ncbi:hypothetical protein B0O80DRAFT_271362 [Mortierella sp. GBAus27b]|nr:hypothetical protein B0O80DRAFT_271362 [Mortierella sp. GBAus27b]
MTTASAPLSATNPIAGSSSPNASYGHSGHYNHHHNNSNSVSSYARYSDSVPSSPTLPIHHPSYPSMPISEPRRSSAPTVSSSSNMQEKREFPPDRRVTIGHTGSHAHYPSVPPSNSTQAGSRASWAGSSTNYSNSEAPYFRGGHDTRDDYHHSPIHGSYHPLGHMDYRTVHGQVDQMHHEGPYPSEYMQQDSYDDYYNSMNGGVRDPNAGAAQDSAMMMMSTVTSAPGTMAMAENNKHRNNSVSSNASQSSVSSLSASQQQQQQGNKHPCKFPTCGWSFKRFEHLKRHMLVHTKERPFVCDFAGCDKSFSRSDNFSAHLRTHTKKAMQHQHQHHPQHHVRRFDRPGAPGMMMMDPIRTNFVNGPNSTMVPGPFSDVPGSEHPPHRHSIAGYPSFSAPRSPLQSQGDYSHGMTR